MRFAVAAIVALGLAGCGGGDQADDRPLSAEAQRGRDLVGDRGCTACHETGGMAPGWDGLYGSEVELEDGRTVVADDAYLTRAITDPGADIVAGYNVEMPDNNLTGDEVASIVAYLRELAAPEVTS